MENEHELSYETLTRVYLGSYEHYKSVGAEANEVLVTKEALQSEVGHLDMLDHEVGSLCDEYAWWKLTRRCWNTHVLAAAIQEEKEIMLPIFVQWNVRYLFLEGVYAA
ncbi:hypothetical protein Tco_0871109 [Tanacetum coccineum]